MRFAPFLSALGIAVLGVSLLACGGTGGSSNENALAASLLLRPEDFPAGWKQAVPPDQSDSTDSEANDPHKACPVIQVSGLRGQAETPDYTDPEDIVLVDQIVRVFDSPGNAADVVTSDAMMNAMSCRVQVLNDGKANTERAQYSDASFEKVNAKRLGDSRAAFRLRVVLTITGDTPGKMPLYLDMLMASQGRIWYVIEATSPFLPIDFWMMTTEELGDESSFMTWLGGKAINRITGANEAVNTGSLGPVPQFGASALARAQTNVRSGAAVAAMKELEHLVQSAFGWGH